MAMSDASKYVVPPKKRRTETAPVTSSISQNAMKMMESLGYVKGHGLGAFGQGRVDPVLESSQVGRRGFGYATSDSESGEMPAIWDPDTEEFSTTMDRDQMTWLSKLDQIDLSQLPEEWIDIANRKLDISDEINFCEPSILKNVLQYKTVFDTMEARVMLDARTRSNPFETIKNGIFMNRAAMKMANIDYLTDFQLTAIPKPGEILYFADVCAGPGGFTEYLLWKNPLKSRGFGFTLRGKNDFRLNSIVAGPVECFSTHYGVQDDGDVYLRANLDHFLNEVHKEIPEGLHLVVADGGFSVDGQENIQEILSKQLYLCQFIFGLALLRPGGNFVCKLFDTFTNFSVGLIYLMAHAFEKVTICKPVTSRPANSERYIICQGKIASEEVNCLLDYLRKVNDKINELKDTDEDVMSIVPEEEMFTDRSFYDYIRDCNDKYGRIQAIALDKTKAFAEDTNLMDSKHESFREQCLKLWNIPDLKRMNTPWPLRSDQKTASSEILRDDENGKMGNISMEFLPNIRKLTLDVTDRSSFVPFCYDAFIGSDSSPIFVYSRGMSEVYKTNDQTQWVQWSDKPLRLPAGTMLWLWEVSEYTGNRINRSYHILDAAAVYGEDLRKKHLHFRIRKAQQMLQALVPSHIPIQVNAQPQQKCDHSLKIIVESKQSTIEKMRGMAVDIDKDEKEKSTKYQTPIHLSMAVKYPLAELLMNKQRISDGHIAVHKLRRISTPWPVWYYDANNPTESVHFPIKGILLIKTTKDPWIIGFSQSQRKPYYFETAKRTSVFDCPEESIQPFDSQELFLFYWYKFNGTDVGITFKELYDSVKNRLPNHEMR